MRYSYLRSLLDDIMTAETDEKKTAAMTLAICELLKRVDVLENRVGWIAEGVEP